MQFVYNSSTDSMNKNANNTTPNFPYKDRTYNNRRCTMTFTRTGEYERSWGSSRQGSASPISYAKTRRFSIQTKRDLIMQCNGSYLNMQGFVPMKADFALH